MPSSTGLGARRALLTRIAKWLGVACLAVVALLLLVLGAAHTPRGRQFVLSQVTSLLASQQIAFNADQLRYNRLIARLAHERGMAVGLKNDLDQIPDLVGDFDFAVNEQCAQYGECADNRPFVDADKAVFHVEYELPTERFCAESRELGLSSMRKKYELGVWREAC